MLTHSLTGEATRLLVLLTGVDLVTGTYVLYVVRHYFSLFQLLEQPLENSIRFLTSPNLRHISARAVWARFNSSPRARCVHGLYGCIMKDGAKMVTVRVDTKPAEAIP